MYWQTIFDFSQHLPQIPDCHSLQNHRILVTFKKQLWLTVLVRLRTDLTLSSSWIICVSVSTSSFVHAVPVNKTNPLHTVKLKDLLAREHRSENTIVTKLMATEKTILEMGCSPSIPLTPLYFRGAHPSLKCARYVTSCYCCCLSLPWTWRGLGDIKWKVHSTSPS